jgi:hypothetical protein
MVKGQLICGVLVIATIAVAGCGSGGSTDRLQLAGKVSVQGEPVKQGEIRLTPINGTPGHANITQIVNGEYQFTGRGIQPGTFRVEIKSYRPIRGANPYTAEQADGHPEIKAGDLPMEQYLPSRFNRDSTLEFTVDGASSEVTKDFDLT